MKNRFGKLLFVLVLLAMVFTLLAACATTPQEPTTEQPAAEEPAAEEPAAEEEPMEEQEPLEFVYGSESILTTPNPAIGWSHYWVRGLTLENLIDDAVLGGYQPGLATEWSVDETGKVWTFKIREGVVFHDGTPCTAEDIAWSINFTIDMELPTMASHVAGIEKVEALDDTTLQVTTENIIAGFDARMAALGMFILPKSVWGDMTSEEILEYQDIDAATGTGPYKLVEFVPNEYLILEAFEDHWSGKPGVDRIIMREYANEDAIYEALRTGEVDFAWIGAQAVDLLEAEPHLTVLQNPGWGIDQMIINSFADGTQPDSLNDPIVRLAMAHATDKEQIVNVVGLGYSQPGWSFITPDFGEWYNSDVQDHPYDLEEANRLLDEAGYVDTDGDGIRNWSDGSNMEYRLYSGDDMGNGPRILELFGGFLDDIGIATEPQVLPIETVISLFPAYDFDFLYWGWGWGGPDPDLPLSVFTCSQTGEGGWSDVGYCNPEYDALYEAQAQETDHEKRVQLVREAQKMFFDDLPYIVFQYEVNLMALNSDKFACMMPMVEQNGFPYVRNTLINAECP